MTVEANSVLGEALGTASSWSRIATGKRSFRARPVEVPRPSRLSLVDLAEYTRAVAAEVNAGRYPHIEYDEQERWHQRIFRDDRVDLWLISWMPTQGTQLHDHGGSSGAFTVAQGALGEAIYRRPRGSTPGALVECRRAHGETVSFGDRYVHDVRNLTNEPAVSVHAYSPPLSVMNYYDTDDLGKLRRIVSVKTDDPEAAVDFDTITTL